jgi:hypothetical protein
MKILNNQEINIFFKSQPVTRFNASKSFYASFIPGQAGSYKQPLRKKCYFNQCRLMFSQIKAMSNEDIEFMSIECSDHAS